MKVNSDLAKHSLSIVICYFGLNLVCSVSEKENILPIVREYFLVSIHRFPHLLLVQKKFRKIFLSKTISLISFVLLNGRVSAPYVITEFNSEIFIHLICIFISLDSNCRVIASTLKYLLCKYPFTLFSSEHLKNISL